MDMFSSSPLMESFPSTRFSSPAPSPTRTENELPIDVDQSFNSSMSLSGGPPSLSPSLSFSKGYPVSPLVNTYDGFLSPTPAFGIKPRRPDPVPIQSKHSRLPSRDQVKPLEGLGVRQLGSGRVFGREISPNAMQRSTEPAKRKASKGMMLPPSIPDTKSFVPKHRGGIPMQWTSSNEEPGVAKLNFQPGMMRRETEPFMVSPRSAKSSDGILMDVDSPRVSSRRTSCQRSPAFAGPASTGGSPGLGSFFCESPAAPSALPPAKRRSLVSGSPASPSSPSAKRASFGLASRNIEKTASSSAMLFGGARPNTLGTRRAQPYKRQLLWAMPTADIQRSDSPASSAYPILYGGEQKATLGQVGTFPRLSTAPMRRAFSVCDQPPMPETDEDESEYEASPSTGGAHAEYARRHGTKYVPRVDGSPGFKPMRSSIAVSGEGMTSPVGKGKKPSPYGPGGLPGFGDNEMDGKILPCHKVKEDGLVRITADTMDELICGQYVSKVKRFHILDCRFDYEYAGGHIAGSINVKSMDALDELLLSEAQGVHANGDDLPAPSRSGELDDGEQVVLILHCEFSAKRAPTFAKHLRSRDRLLNNNAYPKIFYPEVYILEGGYSGFYHSRPERCDPQGYVPMDDPRHFERRASDLHDFRKFSRTRSFTYGETQWAPPRAVGACPPLAFAAASAAQGRRHGPTITEEEHEPGSSPQGCDSSGVMSGREATPCPRIVSFTQAPIFGTAKPRQSSRVGFNRVASYAGTTAR